MFADCISDCLPEKPIPVGSAFMRVHILIQELNIYFEIL